MTSVLRPRFGQIAVVLAALSTLAGSAGAAMDRRLAERLDPATADAVWQVVSASEAAGIPGEPLIGTALEGASKRARGDRIVQVVRRHAAALTTAQLALGKESSSAELVAGAGALMSGVPPDTLSRLRSLRGKASLVVPLVVLADLVTRQVPIATASTAVIHASRVGARDGDLLRLRSRVERDIRKGVSPGAATVAGVEALLPSAPGRPQLGGMRGGDRGVP